MALTIGHGEAAATSPGTSRAGGAILLYHRISEDRPDPQALCVSPARFREHLDVLRCHFEPARLLDLMDPERNRRPKRQAVAVTFDDGYADNLYEAAPLLSAFDVPATVFVVSGNIQTGEPFWWDELGRLLLETPKLPPTICADLNGRRQEWRLEPDAEGNHVPIAALRDWTVLHAEVPTERHRVYAELCNALRPLNQETRGRFLDRLRANASDPPPHPPHRRPLTPEELRQLAKMPGIDLGAHTVTHPVLACLDPADQSLELQSSRRALEAMIGRNIHTLSYPFGTRGDYTPHTVGMAQKAGYVCACANFPGLIGPQTDQFQLPRILIRDVDGHSLLRRLAEVGVGV